MLTKAIAKATATATTTVENHLIRPHLLYLRLRFIGNFCFGYHYNQHIYHNNNYVVEPVRL